MSGNVALLKPSFRKMFTRLMDQKYTNDGAAKNVGLLPCPSCLFSLTSSHEVVLVGGFYYFFLLRIMLAFVAFLCPALSQMSLCATVFTSDAISLKQEVVLIRFRFKSCAIKASVRI